MVGDEQDIRDWLYVQDAGLSECRVGKIPHHDSESDTEVRGILPTVICPGTVLALAVAKCRWVPCFYANRTVEFCPLCVTEIKVVIKGRMPECGT